MRSTSCQRCCLGLRSTELCLYFLINVSLVGLVLLNKNVLYDLFDFLGIRDIAILILPIGHFLTAGTSLEIYRYTDSRFLGGQRCSLYLVLHLHFLHVQIMILDYLQTETGSGFPSRTHPYSKGMFITLSNSKLYYNHLLGTFKRQYQSVLRGLGIKIGRKCIRQSNRMPSKSKIINLIQKGIPIATAAIHDNPDAERDGNYYQHSHFMLYNVSQYLPSDIIDLRSAISKIKRANGRYVGNRHKVNGVDVRPVGTYKHYLEHELEDTN